jgi:hypothetical protein
VEGTPRGWQSTGELNDELTCLSVERFIK